MQQAAVGPSSGLTLRALPQRSRLWRRTFSTVSQQNTASGAAAGS